MIWTAKFADGSSERSEDLEYAHIKDRLNDLISLTVEANGKAISLDWNLLIFKTPDSVISHKDALKLHNPRLIFVRRETVVFTVNREIPLTPVVDYVKIGYQGNDEDGRNVKRYIRFNHNGSYEMYT